MAASVCVCESVCLTGWSAWRDLLPSSSASLCPSSSLSTQRIHSHSNRTHSTSIDSNIPLHIYTCIYSTCMCMFVCGGHISTHCFFCVSPHSLHIFPPQTLEIRPAILHHVLWRIKEPNRWLLLKWDLSIVVDNSSLAILTSIASRTIRWNYKCRHYNSKLQKCSWKKPALKLAAKPI